MICTKKMISLALILMIVLTGCGNNTSPVDNGTGEDSPTEQVSTETPTPESSEATPETAGEAIARGTVDGQVYTNAFANLTFTAPEGWIYSSDEDIAAAMGLGAEYLQSEGLNFSEEALKLSTLYDMMVMDPAVGNNISIMFENLAVNPIGASVDANGYIEILKTQMGAVTGYQTGETGETTVGGEKYVTLDVTFDMSGVTGSQTYLVRKSGNYIIAVIVTAIGDTTASDLLANFA